MTEIRNKKRVGDEINASHEGYEKEGNLGRLKRGMYSRLKQPVSRERREFEEVQAGVGSDWGDGATNATPEDVQSTTQTKEEPVYVAPRPKKAPKIAVIVAGIFAVASLAIAAIYIVGGAGNASPNRVQIDISGPSTIEGGSILSLNVSVKNGNEVDLELADLLVRYPEGTRVPTDLASDMTVQRIPLGTIAAGATKTGTVRAAVFGASGSNKTIDVELEYRAANSNALRVADASRDILITSDTLDISIEADKESVIGQETALAVTITSRSGILLKDVVLTSEYPFGFNVKKLDPKPSNNKDFWEIGDLSSGDKYVLHIKGDLSGASGDERVLRFKAGLRKSRADESMNAELAVAEHVIGLKKPFLGVGMLFDDLDAEEYLARTGETVPVSIYWKNNLENTLTNVVLAASVYGEGVDPYTISADKGFYRSIDSVAMWDRTTTSGAFSSIAAGQQGNLLLRITPRVKEQLAGKENPEVNIEIHAAGQRLSETGVPETMQSTIKETVKIATDIDLSSRALFHENPFESVGPLPPKVHQETTYGIVWEVTNTTNKMRDGTVTAILPPYIRWLGVVSPVAENIVYKQAEGTLTWYLGSVLPGTGVGDTEPRRVAFNIGFVPSAGQVGQSPNLLTDQVLKGFDLFVQHELEAEADDLTINLEEDDFAQGQGTVQP